MNIFHILKKYFQKTIKLFIFNNLPTTITVVFDFLDFSSCQMAYTISKFRAQKRTLFLLCRGIFIFWRGGGGLLVEPGGVGAGDVVAELVGLEDLDFAGESHDEAADAFEACYFGCELPMVVVGRKVAGCEGVLFFEEGFAAAGEAEADGDGAGA